jgi:cysteine desulfurase/selenocysteine lyase
LAERLSQLDGVRVLGEPAEKVCVNSFVVEGLEEPTRLSAYLDAAHGIAVRAGTLSAQPLMNRLGVPGAVRASLSFYNTEDEIEALVHGVRQFLRERPN